MPATPIASASESTATTAHEQARERDQLRSVKETLVGIVIAFAMAFVFRGFVIEGFVIPTGSMAPTLLGQHFKATGPESGYSWEVGPTPRSGSQQPLEVTDPLLRTPIGQGNSLRRSGDRVFVLKYLDGIHEPKRWDVVVFRNPGTRENYIKRLIGKPNEQIALVDGDVFVRDFVSDEATPRRGIDAWTGAGWNIARKPERVQRAVWQDVFDARYTPINPAATFRAPVLGSAGWEGLRGDTASPEYRFTGTGTGTLTWRDNVPLEDWYGYNELQQGRLIPHYPVSDLAISFALEPGETPVTPSFELDARGHRFRAKIEGGPGAYEAVLSMAADPADDTTLPEWSELDRQPVPDDAFAAGRVTSFEFWHTDQALWLFVDDALVAGGPEAGGYDLTPAQRAEFATGNTLEQALDRPDFGNGMSMAGGLGDVSQYRKPGFRLSFSGGPASVHGLKVQRDLHYHVNSTNSRSTASKPTNGAHPDYFPTLDGQRYFVCGDNSPNSKDSRLWLRGDGSADPWVTSEIDPKLPSIDQALLTMEQNAEYRRSFGTVHRDLLIGQGFVVYFPAPTRVFGLPIPDVGKVRWIW